MTNKLSSQNSLYDPNVLEGVLQDSAGRSVLWFFGCCCLTPCNVPRILLEMKKKTTKRQPKGRLNPLYRSKQIDVLWLWFRRVLEHISRIRNMLLNGKLWSLDLYSSPSVLPNAKILLKPILLHETEAFLSSKLCGSFSLTLVLIPYN